MGSFATDTRPPTSPRRIVERALKKPSSTIWLGPVSIPTSRFEDALAFYVGSLGLTLRTVEPHPRFPDRLRAVLLDAEGQDALELFETPSDTATPAYHQLGFRLPLRSWQVLRARLDAQDVPYEILGDVLHLEDRDGIALRVEPLGSC